MVTRIWGTCQGKDVIFSPGEDGLWRCAVPATASGSYVIELWAEDGAGNVGYLATILLAFDLDKLVCRIEILDVGTMLSRDALENMLVGSGPRAAPLEDPFSCARDGDEVFCRVLSFLRCESPEVAIATEVDKGAVAADGTEEVFHRTTPSAIFAEDERDRLLFSDAGARGCVP